MNILVIVMYIINHSEIFNIFFYFQQMIFTETFMNVTEVLQSHASVLTFNSVKMGSVWQKDACNLITDFFLILNRFTAREILHFYDLDRSEMAVEKSRSLWEKVK